LLFESFTVNDFRNFIIGKYSGTIETYRNAYTKLLDTTEKLPNVKLIIGEPYAASTPLTTDDCFLKAAVTFAVHPKSSFTSS
jgi:hypothetical protein